MHDAVNWTNFKRQIIAAFSVRSEIIRSCYYNYQPSRRKGETLAALVDRIANDLDSFTETGVMPELEKLQEVQHLIARVLPSELHFGLPQTIGTLQDLTDELEVRAGRSPHRKLTSQDITNERVENKPWTFNNEKSTVNAVSNSTTAPLVANGATTDNSIVTHNPPPPPPNPTVAATTAPQTTQNAEKPPPSQLQENSVHPRKKDKSKSHQNQQHQQRQRGRNDGQKYGNCHTCGRKGHRRQDCRSLGLTCFNCIIQGHLSSVCRQSKTKHQPWNGFPLATFREIPTILEAYSADGCSVANAATGGNWQPSDDRSPSHRDHPHSSGWPSSSGTTGPPQPLPTSAAKNQLCISPFTIGKHEYPIKCCIKYQ